jgi:chaperonin GroEL
LKALALSVCYDEEMADVLGEVISTIGRYGQVDIRAGHSRGLEYNYVEGSYWKGGAQSKEMLRGYERQVAEMQDTAILITDMDIEEPRELVPVMSLALRCGISQLLLIVHSISETGLSVVLDNRLREKIKTIVVKIDSVLEDEQARTREDIALLTGARPLLQKAGESLEHVRESDFGGARWIWADDKNFGFAGGKGDPRELRAQARSLRQAYAAAEDDDDRRRLLERLGRLNGGLATVYVGGIAEDEIRQRKELTERTVRALRSAAEGVIPGGGIALLRCRDWLLAEAEAQPDLEGRAARRIMAKAAEAPIRQLLENAGYDPSEVLARLQHGGEGSGFDVIRGAVVDLAAAGILDVAQVQVEALQRAVSSAALALTIDVLVLHREPETMTDP